jgi:hypothetical protein
MRDLDDRGFGATLVLFLFVINDANEVEGGFEGVCVTNSESVDVISFN